MEYVGNYPDLVKDEWIIHLLTSTGQLLPDDRECLQPEFHPDNKTMYDSWGLKNRAYWYKFEVQDMPFTIPWPVPLSENIDWWAIKQLPGQCVPMHVDYNPEENTTRYVLMLQDYIPGHVLIWNGKLISDYKKGDIYKVQDVNSTHGSSNISNIPRLIAHLTVWNF